MVRVFALYLPGMALMPAPPIGSRIGMEMSAQPERNNPSAALCMRRFIFSTPLILEDSGLVTSENVTPSTTLGFECHRV